MLGRPLGLIPVSRANVNHTSMQRVCRVFTQTAILNVLLDYMLGVPQQNVVDRTAGSFFELDESQLLQLLDTRRPGVVAPFAGKP